MPSYGPFDAPVLWVGEAPGKDEVAAGRPFVGATGKLLRGALRAVGIDPETMVRWANACRTNVNPFPDGLAGARLLRQWAPQLDADMRAMTGCKVIVACGGAALRRLTGLTNITRWHCSVLRNKDIPDVLVWHKGGGKGGVHPIHHATLLPPDVVIIPVLHPAGIMRSKGWDDMLWVRRAVDKVRRALAGALRPVVVSTDFYPPPAAIERAAAKAKWVYFDTEFNPESKEIFWVGLTFDGEYVMGCPWDYDYILAVKAVLENPAIKKCAHNIHADIKVLEAAGVNVAGELYDTMIGMHALHPALDVGLDDTARYYLDDVHQWKDMDTKDPMYNAYDVVYGAQSMLAQHKEAAARPVDPTDELEQRMRLLRVTYAMEKRGMCVDETVRKELVKEAVKEIDALCTVIAEAARPMWDVRVRNAMREERYEGLMWRKAARGSLIHHCDTHPRYTGMRKPPKLCERCGEIFVLMQYKREQKVWRKKRLDAARHSVKRWEVGFDPGNNEHVRWLLYDSHAFGLPEQKHRTTKKLTADRTAIDKLLLICKEQPQHAHALTTIKQIKEVQHLRKALATFLFEATDEEEGSKLDATNVAHPPYKIHGTRTGRLAGGSDADERADNTFAFNPLNIPKQWRVMYVPPPGCVFVAADWRNVEGRLTAYFCKDSAYQAALDDELRGGYKVHARNAAVIYGIDPADAMTHMISLGGQQRPAYDGGKRLTHAWSYGMGHRKMADTYGISLREAGVVDIKLSSAYPQLVKWRTALVTGVLGLWERRFGKVVCVQEGRRYLANPFGWQLHFLGMGGAQANEVVAFLPQSTGAGMWTRIAPLLEERYPIFTGTYDSFVLTVPEQQWKEAASFLQTTMERPWAELDGRTFPCEVSVGYNWGEYDEQHNRYGLKKIA